ncbi:GATA zinc finger domain-containing protein 1 [Acropora cervicornis]|uniref:GATA zinc finger domain-containing protein 1 n=1 Tax=Acropora cervicornis TaxID=6130 RepID=A0AAD9V2C2_ACRCE|nr:PREDICTED: GATA zinc finger domain-containing protein 1-like [Acropora digitifera]XP_029202300.2 GATA zinc finger domain-containing protein 1-like [Acropora millepora]KAK2558663.1 GATA zinc finger domain-containing protein 1 [Acropora cervicornis]
MSLDNSPQCSACKIATSLMWRKGSNGDVLCNSCHLKRVNTSIRIQRQSSKESKKLVARIKASTRKGYNGKSGERSRGRRALQKIKRKPYKSPEGFATIVAADRMYFKGILYQAGDIVSIEDIDGDLYYAQLRGFMQDQYAQKTAVITWLIPVVPRPSHFDPVLFLPGPEEDTPRPMECMEFVCRAPTELFKAKREHPPFIFPRQPNLHDLASAAELLLQSEDSCSALS